MGERGVLQRHSNALIFVLAGTAAVAVAAACYNRRHRLPKRPHDGQQSANLQHLLAEVRGVPQSRLHAIRLVVCLTCQFKIGETNT